MKVALKTLCGVFSIAYAAIAGAAFVPSYLGGQMGYAGTNSGFTYLPTLNLNLAGDPHAFSEPVSQSGSGGESAWVIREGKINDSLVWLSSRNSTTVRSSCGATSWYDFVSDTSQVKLEYKVILSRLVWWDMSIVRLYDKTAGTIMVTHEENGTGTEIINVTPGHTLELYIGLNQNNLNGYSYPAGNTAFTAEGKLTPIPEAPLSSIVLLPNSVVGGSKTQGIVRLAGKAGPYGSVVALSADPGVTVPSTVTVAAGSTYVVFDVATNAVDEDTAVNVSATYRSVTKGAVLTLHPAPLSSIVVLPNSVIGGASTAGIVRLSGVAGPSGSVVSLSAGSGAIVPATVTILAGQSYAKFTVKTIAVDASTPATIGASLGVVSKSTTLTVLPAPLASIALSPTSVVGGFGARGVVRLTAAAGPSGTVVSLAAEAGASVPASVKVPAGATAVSFAINTVPVDENTLVSISASLNSVEKSATLTVLPAPLSSFVILPNTVKGGANTTGLVRLSAKAGPSGAVVTITGAAGVTVPATVTVPAGATYVTFVINTSKVTVSTPVDISVSRGATTLTKTLTLTP